MKALDYATKAIVFIFVVAGLNRILMDKQSPALLDKLFGVTRSLTVNTLKGKQA